MRRSAYCWIPVGLAVALLSVSSQTGAAPKTNKSAQPVARSASAPLEGRAADDLIYPFVVVPRRIELSDNQVDAVRNAAVKQVLEYHHSFAESNRSAAESHAEDIADRARANAHSEWNRQHVQRVLASQHQTSETIFHVVVLVVAVALLLTVYQFIRDSALAERAAFAILGSRGDVKSGRKRKSSDVAVPDPKGPQPGENLHFGERHEPGGPAAPELSEAALAKFAELTANNPQSKEAILELLKLAKTQHNLTLGPNGLQLGSQFVGLVVLAFSLAFFYLYLTNVYPISFETPAVEVAPKDQVPS